MILNLKLVKRQYNEPLYFLSLIVALYECGLLQTHKQLKGMLTYFDVSYNPFDNGHFNLAKRTYKRNYKCSFNGIWYNDENMVDIFEGILAKNKKTYIALENLYMAYKLMNGSTKNRIVAGKFSEVLTYTLTGHLSYGDIERYSSASELFDLPNPEYYERGGYCCSECDGERDEYNRHYRLDCAKNDVLNFKNTLKRTLR